MARVKAPIRLGMIGCGGISRAHARALAQLSQLFEVRSVCDLDRSLARERAAELSCENVVADWRDVVGDPGLDAVDVTLPHDLHHPVGIAAAKAGKHILMEKPLAISLKQGREMAETAEDAGVRLMVAFNERHRWPVKQMKAIVDAGRIGNVYLVRTDHNQYPRFAPDHWFRKRDRAGGGTLIGSGIHMLDLLHWFGGDVASVCAVTHRMPDRVDDAEAVASVVVEYKHGGIGSLDISWAAPNHPWYQFLVVYGTKGTLTSLGGDVTISTVDGTETMKSSGEDTFAESFRAEIEYFGRCLVEGTEPMTNARDALASLEICMAAYRAAETRTQVRIPLSE